MKESPLWKNAGKILDELLDLERTTVTKTMDLGDILNELKESTPPKQWAKERSKRLPKLKADKDERARKCATNREVIESWLEDDPDMTLTEILELLKDPVEKKKTALKLLARAENKMFRESYELWTSGVEENRESKQVEIIEKYNKKLPMIRHATRVRYREHFLDSGAFGLFGNEVSRYRRKHNGEDNAEWGYYESEEFFHYMDRYAEFVKEHKVGIDYYANVDAIGNPEISWRNQQYLESRHGLQPVPTIHFPGDLKWAKHYLDRDYKLIAIGGVASHKKGKGEDEIKEGVSEWVDKFFKIVCDENGKPKVRVHLFGTTRISLIGNNPFWSADSTTWSHASRNGNLLIPKKDENGEYQFDIQNETLSVDDEENKEQIEEWLDYLGVSNLDLDETSVREELNLLFHEELTANI